MPENELYYWWTLGYAIGTAVVVIVAVLLVIILLVARKIAHLASLALSVAGEIKAGTQPIWSLADANATFEDIVRSVRSIDARVTSIADALSPETASGKGRKT